MAELPAAADVANAAVPAASGAGALLRAARQSQGLHIGALAASIKVPQSKLEALEADRYQDLPDVTFARALAQTVCRVLKIDPGPVLARLPTTNPVPLARVDGGLNMPFRERPGRIDPIDWVIWRRPAFWMVAVFLSAAAVVAFTPTSWFQGLARLTRLADQSPGAVETAMATALPAVVPASALAGGIVERSGLNPGAVPGATPDATAAAVERAAQTQARAAGPASPAATVSSSTPLAASAATAVVHSTRIRAVEATWVRITDGRGQILLSRVLSSGESVGFDAEPPLWLRIGNARGTEILRHGQVLDLAASTRDNVANVEIR